MDSPSKKSIYECVAFSLLIAYLFTTFIVVVVLANGKSPRFNIDRIYIQEFNLTSSSSSSSSSDNPLAMLTEIEISITNPNKIGYNNIDAGGNVTIYYNTIPLGTGLMPKLELAAHKTKTVPMTLMGRVLSNDWKEILVLSKGKYTFDVDLKVPLHMISTTGKSIIERQINIKSHCGVVVDMPMAEDSKVISGSCASR
ncbi:hypothetical protein QJS10_CPB18g02085 [Acorus calamus]|uniref:Late embryogenesis abundant protein LEA-2 subgroup domain-containing protein n=1 Tax=Acorus calamus TaxID=4465 RepID=A0AAV9CKA1_ACOCL|nr:hypothetical protein QJS10_CPB18g02085 [Acorus calamus]